MGDEVKGEVALRARELIRQSCMSRDIQILQGHISKDHVYILVSSAPSLSPAKIMQYVKGRTSRMLQDEFSHLKKRYWGQHLWARGYYCATVGTVTDEQIRAYIERHKQEPFPDNFKIDT